MQEVTLPRAARSSPSPVRTITITGVLEVARQAGREGEALAAVSAVIASPAKVKAAPKHRLRQAAAAATPPGALGRRGGGQCGPRIA